MSSIYLHYANIRALVSAIGRSHTLLDLQQSTDLIANALAMKSGLLLSALREPETPGQPGVRLTAQNYLNLLRALGQQVGASIPNRTRVELVASAFGCRGDALMHHLKTTTRHLASNPSLEPRQPVPALEQMAKAGYRDIDSWLSAVQSQRGLCFISGDTGMAKSTFQQMTGRFLTERGAETLIIEEPIEYSQAISGAREKCREKIRSATFAWLRGQSQAENQSVILFPDIMKRDDLILASKFAEHAMVIACVNSSSLFRTVERFSAYVERSPYDFLADVRGIAHLTLMRKIGDPAASDQSKRYTGRFPICENVSLESDAIRDVIASRTTARRTAQRLGIDVADIFDESDAYSLPWKPSYKIALDHLVAGDIDVEEFGWNFKPPSRAPDS